WWLRAHWGRAFDVVWLRRGALAGDDGQPGHDLALLRRREVAVTREELEAPDPGEPREARAADYAAHIAARADEFAVAPPRLVRQPAAERGRVLAGVGTEEVGTGARKHLEADVAQAGGEAVALRAQRLGQLARAERQPDGGRVLQRRPAGECQVLLDAAQRA